VLSAFTPSGPELRDQLGVKIGDPLAHPAILQPHHPAIAISDLFAAWTRLNLDEVMSYFAEDAVWDNVPRSPAKGKQAIRMTHGFMKDMSTFSVKILKSLHEGNVVFDSRVDTITMKSGKKAEVPLASMFELNDAGKIKVSRDYFDLATFTRQIS
jgi:limonene-1,2-epoxide hydrolase